MKESVAAITVDITNNDIGVRCHIHWNQKICRTDQPQETEGAIWKVCAKRCPAGIHGCLIGSATVHDGDDGNELIFNFRALQPSIEWTKVQALPLFLVFISALSLVKESQTKCWFISTIGRRFRWWICGWNQSFRLFGFFGVIGPSRWCSSNRYNRINGWLRCSEGGA